MKFSVMPPKDEQGQADGKDFDAVEPAQLLRIDAGIAEQVGHDNQQHVHQEGEDSGPGGAAQPDSSGAGRGNTGLRIWISHVAPVQAGAWNVYMG